MTSQNVPFFQLQNYDNLFNHQSFLLFFFFLYVLSYQHNSKTSTKSLILGIKENGRKKMTRKKERFFQSVVFPTLSIINQQTYSHFDNLTRKVGIQCLIYKVHTRTLYYQLPGRKKARFLQKQLLTELKWAIFTLVKDFPKALLFHLPHHFISIYCVTAMAYIASPQYHIL